MRPAARHDRSDCSRCEGKALDPGTREQLVHGRQGSGRSHGRGRADHPGHRPHTECLGHPGAGHPGWRPFAPARAGHGRFRAALHEHTHHLPELSLGLQRGRAFPVHRAVPKHPHRVQRRGLPQHQPLGNRIVRPVRRCGGCGGGDASRGQ